MISKVLPLILTVAGVYAALCLLVFLLQRRLVYFPGPPPGSDPGAYGLPFTDLTLTTADGVKIHGWFVPAPAARGALVFPHGNAGNIEYRLMHARAFRQMGLSVLLFDYRGYGKSEGTPSEKGTYLDAEAAYDWLLQQGFAPERIAVYGESLGGAVGIELARRRQVACVAVESAFTSVPDLGAQLYPWLPVRLLSRFRYDNAKKIANLGVPVLVIHSPDDEIIPYAHGEALFAAAAEPKRFLQTSRRHNDGGFLQRRDWIDAVRAFFEEALP